FFLRLNIAIDYLDLFFVLGFAARRDTFFERLRMSDLYGWRSGRFSYSPKNSRLFYFLLFLHHSCRKLYQKISGNRAS
ncbi:MAG: hypothetical protein C4325_10630, partial [Blastocatellia bacterium]